MQPPKKPPSRASDLRDHSRNARQKSVLLCEVTRLRVNRGGELCRDSRELAGKEPFRRDR